MPEAGGAGCPPVGTPAVVELPFLAGVLVRSLETDCEFGEFDEPEAGANAPELDCCEALFKLELAAFAVFGFPSAGVVLAVSDCRNALVSVCAAENSLATGLMSEGLPGGKSVPIAVPICVITGLSSDMELARIGSQNQRVIVAGPLLEAVGFSGSFCSKLDNAERMIELRGSPLLRLLKISCAR